MDVAATEVARLEKELAAARQRLSERATASVKEVIASLPYTSTKSEGIRVTGPYADQSRWHFVIPSDEYVLGTADLPMSDFCKARVLDLSTVFADLWNPIWDSPNILLRVQKYLEGKWEEIATYDLFKLPIDLTKKAKGYNKCDLPNVSYAVTVLMLRHNIEFVVCDPIHRGTDASVRIVNYSVALRSLQDNRSKRILTPLHSGDVCPHDSLKIVFFQFGSGQPDPLDEARIESATGLTSANILRVRLAPGKYDRGICTWGSCYSTFKASNAMILHELSVLDTFAHNMKKRTINKVYFVLDPFSAYAAYTAVAIMAYGLDPVASILCFHKGTYTPMDHSRA